MVHFQKKERLARIDEANVEATATYRVAQDLECERGVLFALMRPAVGFVLVPFPAGDSRASFLDNALAAASIQMLTYHKYAYSFSYIARQHDEMDSSRNPCRGW